ncbi:MAG: acyltransferase [Bacteroidales bacterium]
MSFYDLLDRNPGLKNTLRWMLTPRGQARPRLWVKLFLNPFFIKRGKGSRIRRRTRIDILPGKYLKLGQYSTIEDFTTINNGVGTVRIGHHTRVGIGSVIIGPVSIGNNVRLAQHVVLSGLNHNYEDVQVPISEQGVQTSDIYIGDGTWIGANAIVLPGIFIGKHCVVAAGSVVTKDIPSYTVVAGNPARVMKTYDRESKQWIRNRTT